MKKAVLNAYNGKDKFQLSEFIDLTQKGGSLNWYLVEINGYGYPPGETMPEYQDRITERTAVVWSAWSEIQDISGWIQDLNWFWLVGYRRPEIQLESFEGTLEFASFEVQVKVHDSTWVDLRYKSGSSFIDEEAIGALSDKYGDWSPKRARV